jgi:hypothetical protein
LQRRVDIPRRSARLEKCRLKTNTSIAKCANLATATRQQLRI